ncbi:Rieske (2Fe-2S) protein [Antrihabitans cavernicola]|uniref:Cytochrome bc1 complex Rieske iron-sulfur subunit n=1 Tax=Antrihabitans cavernicola TaxID=2495913 RepID=A0A5A7SHB9_9NOCA|nr:Rieske (2Fe-2S) protein [Spelaeibacter cavernicola]KAA0024117.1 Rieske (2Fe-2S) protein [Spelaeibacter cavernicola]
MNSEELVLSRRAVVAGVSLAAAVAGLAACGSSDSGSGSASAAPASAGSTPAALGKVSDVPVGSGAIFGEVVVTQPAAGEFEGFSSKCTHAGCTVSTVSDGTINCPCHGSKFGLDGSVVHGPAKRPLDGRAVKVQGDSIVLA